MLKVLIIYLTHAMLAWSPTRNHIVEDKRSDVTLARYDSYATTIAEVALDPAEPPLFAGDDGRAKTALVLLSLAWFEGGFAGRVDQGKCHPWECDGGLAVSLWQIHPDEGLVLDGDVYQRAGNFSWSWRKDHEAEIVTRERMIADRKVAARMALHIARFSMKRGAGLCAYTGEETGCTKAAARLNHAQRWARSHPWAPIERTMSPFFAWFTW